MREVGDRVQVGMSYGARGVIIAKKLCLIQKDKVWLYDVKFDLEQMFMPLRWSDESNGSTFRGYLEVQLRSLGR